MEELAAGIRRRAAVLYKIMSVGRAIRTAGYDKLMLRVANPKQRRVIQKECDTIQGLNNSDDLQFLFSQAPVTHTTYLNNL